MGVYVRVCLFVCFRFPNKMPALHHHFLLVISSPVSSKKKMEKKNVISPIPWLIVNKHVILVLLPHKEQEKVSRCSETLTFSYNLLSPIYKLALIFSSLYNISLFVCAGKKILSLDLIIILQWTFFWFPFLNSKGKSNQKKKVSVCWCIRYKNKKKQNKTIIHTSMIILKEEKVDAMFAYTVWK